jgi:hypothetical protein
LGKQRKRTIESATRNKRGACIDLHGEDNTLQV